MPDIDLPEFAETDRGEVMHGLGIIEHGTKTRPPREPRLRDARRLAARRSRTPAQTEDIARQAIRDWRATRRAQEQSREGVGIGQGYLTHRPTEKVGVRMQVTINFYANGRVVRTKTISVLMTVNPNLSRDDLETMVLLAVESGAVQLPGDSARGGTAFAAELVQLVEKPWSHAQLGFD